MEWILYSFLMLLSSVVLYLLLRKMQKVGLPGSFLNLVFVALPIPVLLGIILLSGKSLLIGWPLLILILLASIVFVFIGNTFSLIAIEKAPNSGYSLMIQKSYAIYTSLGAALFFGAEINLKSVIGILLVVGFSVLIMFNRPEKGEKFVLERKWVLPSLLAFFMFGNYALAAKWFLMQGIDPLVLVLYVYIFGTIMYALAFNRELKLKQVTMPNFNTGIVIMLLIMSGSALAFDAFNQMASNIAPNVGFVNAFNIASITLITLLSAFFFKEKLSTQKIIGIIGVSLGILVLVIK